MFLPRVYGTNCFRSMAYYYAKIEISIKNMTCTLNFLNIGINVCLDLKKCVYSMDQNTAARLSRTRRLHGQLDTLLEGPGFNPHEC